MTTPQQRFNLNSVARAMAAAGVDRATVLDLTGVAPEPGADEITRWAEQLDPSDFDPDPRRDLDLTLDLLASDCWLEADDPEACRAEWAELAHRQLGVLLGETPTRQ